MLSYYKYKVQILRGPRENYIRLDKNMSSHSLFLERKKGKIDYDDDAHLKIYKYREERYVADC